MKNGRIVADSIKNADTIIEELFDLYHRADVLRDACMPLQMAVRNGGPRKSPPTYVAETGRVMKDRFIPDFRTEYPALSSAVINGQLGRAHNRINDAVYKLGNALILMKDRKFMVISEEERQRLYDQLSDIMADVIIYTIIAFGLHKAESGHETLAVSTACEKRQITASVLYGNLLEDLKRTGRTYYAYEELSPVYNDLLAVDPVFLAECEENDLPLTEEIARKVVDGSMTAASAMVEVMRGAEDYETREIEADPFSIITRMKLE